MSSTSFFPTFSHGHHVAIVDYMEVKIIECGGTERHVICTKFHENRLIM